MNDLWWKFKETGRLIKKTMSQIVDQVLVASGGLNYDDDARLFQGGDTNYRLNVVPTASGSEYVLTNLKGTTKKTHSFTHDSGYDGATYTTIGSCYDVKRNAIYYFIHSSLTNHSILRYNIDKDTFDKIIWENTKIGLDTDYPINDAYIMDDWLFWNPRNTSPRSINVQWAYYDYVSYGATADRTFAVDDYGIDNYNGVWKCTSSVNPNGTYPWDLPDNFEWVSWCYKDTWYQGGAKAGTLLRERSFFNTTPTLVNPVEAEVGSDTSYQSNHIRGNVFQFAYRVYIPEQGYSVSSMFNGTVGVFEGESYEGEFPGKVTIDNKITLRARVDTLDTGLGAGYEVFDVDVLFDHIEFLMRNEKNGDWYSLKKMGHYEAIQQFLGVNNPYVEIDFYNNSSYSVVDNLEIETPYNYLPRTVESQCSLDGERVAYGEIKEGFPETLTTVALTPNYETVDYIKIGIRTGSRSEETIVFEESISRAEWETQFSYTSDSIVKTDVTAGDVLEATMDGQKYYYTVTAADIDDDDAKYATAVTSFLNSVDTFWSVESATIETVSRSASTRSTTIVVDRYVSTKGVTLTGASKHKTFKSGAWHNLCIYYYDGLLRRNDAIPIDPVYVPFPNELDETDGTGFRRYISYTISSNAPTWASWWRFGYAGNSSVEEFWQYNIKAAGLSGAGETTGLSFFDISPLQGIKDDDALTYNYLNTKIDSYQFEEGDRVRVVTRDAAATYNGNLNLDLWYAEYASGITDGSTTSGKLIDSGGDFVTDNVVVGMTVYNTTDDTTAIITDVAAGGTELSLDTDIMATGENYSVRLLAQHDYEIVSFDTTTNYIYFNSDGYVNSATVAPSTLDYNDTSVVIEIYRPKKPYETLIYKEIGELNGVTVVSGTGTHANATGRINSGDAYLISRTMSLTPGFTTPSDPIFVESYSWSDFYESDLTNGGKIGADIGIGETENNTIRYGNRYVKNTLASSFSRFDGLDYKTLSSNYGGITAMRQIGDVLKVIFENNVTSVLVNKTQFFNADGTSQVVKSDNVLGSVNNSEEMFGCVNPESVLVVDRNIFFFDLRRKCYVRNAPNGSFPISDYKMKKYFIDKSDSLLSSGTDYIKVRSGWDDDSGVVYVGFEDAFDPTNTEIILFHEKANRWVGFAELYHSRPYYNLPQFPDLSSVSIDGIDVSLTNAIGATTQVCTIDIEKTGSWSYPVYIDDTPTINLNDGDSVYVAIAGTGGAFKDYVYLTVDFSATGPSDDTIDMDANDTYVTTAACTMRLRLAVAGVSVSISDQAVFTITATVTRKTIPVMQSSSSDLFTISGEDIYLLNDNTTRCNFYGAQKEYSTRVYGLESPNIIKVFESIALHTNAKWDITDIQIPATLNYPNGMQSKIPEGRFEKEEGVLRSDYLCNMKTNQSTAEEIDLVNGDNLRGYIIYQDLDGDETTEHNLYKVDVLSTPSKY